MYVCVSCPSFKLVNPSPVLLSNANWECYRLRLPSWHRRCYSRCPRWWHPHFPLELGRPWGRPKAASPILKERFPGRAFNTKRNEPLLLKGVMLFILKLWWHPHLTIGSWGSKCCHSGNDSGLLCRKYGQMAVLLTLCAHGKSTWRPVNYQKPQWSTVLTCCDMFERIFFLILTLHEDHKNGFTKQHSVAQLFDATSIRPMQT